MDPFCGTHRKMRSTFAGPSSRRPRVHDARELATEPKVAGEIDDLRVRDASALRIIEGRPRGPCSNSCCYAHRPELATTCSDATQMRERVSEASIAQPIA